MVLVLCHSVNLFQTTLLTHLPCSFPSCHNVNQSAHLLQFSFQFTLQPIRGADTYTHSHVTHESTYSLVCVHYGELWISMELGLVCMTRGVSFPYIQTPTVNVVKPHHATIPSGMRRARNTARREFCCSCYVLIRGCDAVVMLTKNRRTQADTSHSIMRVELHRGRKNNTFIRGLCHACKLTHKSGEYYSANRFAREHLSESK